MYFICRALERQLKTSLGGGGEEVYTVETMAKPQQEPWPGHGSDHSQAMVLTMTMVPSNHGHGFTQTPP